MGVDRIAGNEIDQVGLEDHGLASDVDREEAKSRGKDLVELLGVLVCIEDRDSRSFQSVIRMKLGQKKGSRDGGCPPPERRSRQVVLDE